MLQDSLLYYIYMGKSQGIASAGLVWMHHHLGSLRARCFGSVVSYALHNGMGTVGAGCPDRHS